MAEYKFKIGDVVQLKSGGPEMTVYGIIGETNLKEAIEVAAKSFYPEGSVLCQWFAGDGITLIKNHFIADTLQLSK